jgi:diguanylate cyclase (GGDEF)-like protein
LLRWFGKSLARRLAFLSALTTGAVLAVSALALHRHWASDLMLAVSLIVLMTSGVWLTINRLLGQPLSNLTRTMNRATKEGDFLLRVRADRQDEIGALGQAFNTLLAKITDLNVSVIDTERMVEAQKRELLLLQELAEKERVLSEANRQMEQQVRELSLLFDITRTINSTLELKEVLQMICTRVGETLGFEEFAILLMEDRGPEDAPASAELPAPLPGQGRLVVRATYGFPPEESVEGMSFSPGEGISGIVAKTGEWLLIADTAKDTRYLHYKGRHLADGSFLCVPIKLQDRLIGLFNVLRPRMNAFSEGDIRLLTSLANYAALALANAQLHGRIKNLSVTDELTSLANRRRLLERAELELERAGRFKSQVSCLMIDIDHFKRFNDAHGHLRGDEVLRGVSSVLRRELRNVDLIARYGGEEFVVLLPSVGRADALVVAEKLRTAVQAARFDAPITMSVGLATFPADASGVPDLLEASDRALFAAKRGGRNQVRTYEPTLPATPESTQPLAAGK